MCKTNFFTFTFLWHLQSGLLGRTLKEVGAESNSVSETGSIPYYVHRDSAINRLLFRRETKFRQFPVLRNTKFRNIASFVFRRNNNLFTKETNSIWILEFVWVTFDLIHLRIDFSPSSKGWGNSSINVQDLPPPPAVLADACSIRYTEHFIRN